MQPGTPSPPAPAGRGGRRRSRLIALLRVLLGAAVLLLVARTLPWSDELLFHAGVPGAERSLALAGEIEGAWTGDEVLFKVDAGQAADEAWPAEARSAAAAGGALRVRRGPPDAALGGAYDWRPSMPRAFRELDPAGLGTAVVIFTLAMACAVTRWWRLLALLACRTTWLNTWRLTFLGMFFNLVVPGLTGGDVVKGVIVAHENPGRRGEALLSVVIDRLIGMVALIGLALAAILVSGGFGELRLPVLLLLCAVVLGVACYVSRPLRRLVRFDALLARLPFGARLRPLDEAALTLAGKPREMALALGLSLMNHALNTLGFVALGRAFAVSGVSLQEYFVLVPIANMISALPLAPGGWGVGEAAFKMLFEMSGGDGGLGVAVSVTFRLSQLAYGLVGGVFLMLPRARAELHASAARAELEPRPASGARD